MGSPAAHGTGEVGALYDETATLELKQIADGWISNRIACELRVGGRDPDEQNPGTGRGIGGTLIVITVAAARWDTGPLAASPTLFRASPMRPTIIRPHDGEIREVGTIPEFGDRSTDTQHRS